MNLREIPRKTSAKELLGQVLAEADGFTEIVILAFDVDGYAVYNTDMSRSRVIGCLELAKYELLSGE